MSEYHDTTQVDLSTSRRSKRRNNAMARKAKGKHTQAENESEVKNVQNKSGKRRGVNDGGDTRTAGATMMTAASSSASKFSPLHETELSHKLQRYSEAYPLCGYSLSSCFVCDSLLSSLDE